MLQFLPINLALKQYIQFTGRERLFALFLKISSRPVVLRSLSQQQNASQRKKMSDTPLDSVADVEIDSSGKFKYILIKIRPDDDENNSKYIVRGYGWAGYHADIFDEVEPKLRSKKISCDCEGGGRIQHKPQAKTILVYGYSQGFGRADHSITVEKLKAKYPGYTSITFNNEGY